MIEPVAAVRPPFLAASRSNDLQVIGGALQSVSLHQLPLMLFACRS
jgi:hypothetical protein